MAAFIAGRRINDARNVATRGKDKARAYPDQFGQAVPMTAMNAAEGAEAVALRVRQAAERLLAA